MDQLMDEKMPLFDEDLIFEENPDEFHTRIEDYVISEPVNLIKNKYFTKYISLLNNKLLEEDSSYYKIYLSKDMTNSSITFSVDKYTNTSNDNDDIEDYFDEDTDDTSKHKSDEFVVGRIYYDKYDQVVAFDGYASETANIIIENYKLNGHITNNKYAILNILFVLCETRDDVKRESLFPYYVNDFGTNEIICRIRYNRNSKKFEVKDLNKEITNNKFKEFIDILVEKLNDNFSDNIPLLS